MNEMNEQSTELNEAVKSLWEAVRAVKQANRQLEGAARSVQMKLMPKDIDSNLMQMISGTFSAYGNGQTSLMQVETAVAVIMQAAAKVEDK